jgi:hypothetical protein
VHVQLVGQGTPYPLEPYPVHRFACLQFVEFRELLAKPFVVGDYQRSDVSHAGADAPHAADLAVAG